MNSPITGFLAAPFFNEKQVSKVKTLLRYLEEEVGVKMWTVTRDGKPVRQEDSKMTWSEAFKMNVDALIATDWVIAIIDDRDIGTAWEMGYHMASGKPVISVTFEDHGTNLMLAEGIVAHCKTLSEVSQVVKAVVEAVGDRREAEEVSKMDLRYMARQLLQEQGFDLGRKGVLNES